MTNKMKLLIVCLLLLVALIVFPLFFTSKENMENDETENTENETASEEPTDQCDVELTDELAACYLNRNLDIQELFGYNIRRAKLHWNQIGCKEGRSYECGTETASAESPEETPSDLNEENATSMSAEQSMQSSNIEEVSDESPESNNVNEEVNSSESSSVEMTTDKCNIELSDEMARCYMNRHMDIIQNDLNEAKEHWKKYGCMNNLSYECKGEIVDECSQNNKQRETYVGPDGNEIYVYNGDDGNQIIEGPNGTKYVVKLYVFSKPKTKEVSNKQNNCNVEMSSNVEEQQKAIENVVNGANGVTVTKYTGENGQQIVLIKRPNGDMIVIGPNGEISNLNNQQFSSNPVRMYDHDKYILKTQVVPPVCPSCPGLEPRVYGDESSERILETNQQIENVQEPQQQMAQNMLGAQQQMEQNILQNRQEMAQNIVNNTPQYREQIGSLNNVSNTMQYNPQNGDLLGNNIDSYTPQSILTDFSNFGH